MPLANEKDIKGIAGHGITLRSQHTFHDELLFIIIIFSVNDDGNP